MKSAIKFVWALFLLPLVAAAQPAWLEDGLVAYYQFDGDANDASSNGNDGVVAGALSFDTTGINITDRSGRVDIPRINSSDLTAVLQYTPSKLRTWKTLLDWGGPDNHHLIVNGEGAIGTFSGSFNDSGYRLQVGISYHIILVKKGSNSSIYVNGSKIYEITDFSNADFPVQVIGNHSGGGQGAFGVIREVRIYNRALSATEVAELYGDDSTLLAKPIHEWIDDGLVMLEEFNEPFGSFELAESANAGLGTAGKLMNSRHEFTADVNSRHFTLAYWFRGGNQTSQYPEVWELGPKGCGNWQSTHYFSGRDVDSLPVFRNAVGRACVGYPDEPLHYQIEYDTFAHIVASYDGDKVYTFIDGIQVDEVDTPEEAAPSANVAQLFAGGCCPGREINGVYDNIRIYNRPLTATEVAELFVYESGANLPARANANVVAGFVVGVNILSSGAGYDRQPEIKFIGGSPVEEAQADAVIDDGQLVAIDITNAGSGYQGVPSVRIESPSSQAFLSIDTSKIESIVPESERPRRAIATANVINGFLVSADIVDGGIGYEQAPIVTVSDATGTGALAAATIENGVVTSVQFVKAGIGYSDKALIQFQSPPPNPDAIPRVTEIELSMQLRFANNYYVIEASSDLVNWEQIVEPFFAEETTHTVKVAVDDDVRYFRAIQLP